MPCPTVKATAKMILAAALDEHDNIHGARGYDFMPEHWSHFARKMLGAPPYSYRVFPDGTSVVKGRSR